MHQRTVAESFQYHSRLKALRNDAFTGSPNLAPGTTAEGSSLGILTGFMGLADQKDSMLSCLPTRRPPQHHIRFVVRRKTHETLSTYNSHFLLVSFSVS